MWAGVGEEGWSWGPPTNSSLPDSQLAWGNNFFSIGGGRQHSTRLTSAVCDHLCQSSPILGLTRTLMVKDCSCQPGCGVCVVGLWASALHVLGVCLRLTRE